LEAVSSYIVAQVTVPSKGRADARRDTSDPKPTNNCLILIFYYTKCNELRRTGKQKPVTPLLSCCCCRSGKFANAVPLL